MSVSTCNEGVLDAEAKALQLLVTGKLDPHETSRRRDQAWVLSPTEAIYEWWESKRPIADFDVVEAALEWGLDVVILIEGQLNPLPGESFGEQQGRVEGKKQRERKYEKNKIRPSLCRIKKDLDLIL